MISCPQNKQLGAKLGLYTHGVMRVEFLKEKELKRLMAELQTAQATIAQIEAESVSNSAHADARGVQHAAREARVSPS